jgi:hypothetical protein
MATAATKEGVSVRKTKNISKCTFVGSLAILAGVFCLLYSPGNIMSNLAFATGVYARDTVGFYKVTVVEGINLVSLPLVPYSSSMSDVIGSQLTGAEGPDQADRIWKWNNDTQQYEYAWLSTYTGYEGWRDPVTWEPTTLILNPDEAFWIQVRQGHGAKTIVFTGKVSDVNRTVNAIPGMQLIGSSYPVVVALNPNDANLNATGAQWPDQADRIWKWNKDTQQYEYAWLSTYPSYEGWVDPIDWLPTMIMLEPGQGYWLQVRAGHSGFVWNYPKLYAQPPNN